MLQSETMFAKLCTFSKDTSSNFELPLVSLRLCQQMLLGILRKRSPPIMCSLLTWAKGCRDTGLCVLPRNATLRITAYRLLGCGTTAGRLRDMPAYALKLI